MHRNSNRQPFFLHNNIFCWPLHLPHTAGSVKIIEFGFRVMIYKVRVSERARVHLSWSSIWCWSFPCWIVGCSTLIHLFQGTQRLNHTLRAWHEPYGGISTSSTPCCTVYQALKTKFDNPSFPVIASSSPSLLVFLCRFSTFYARRSYETCKFRRG